MALRKKAKKTKSRATTKKAPAKPALPTYEDLIAARNDMEAAQAQVYQADLAVRRAYTYLGDFNERDRRTAEAQADLNRARNRAAEATDKFHTLQRQARGKS